MSDVRLAVIVTAATLVLVEAAAAGPCSRRIAPINVEVGRMASAIHLAGTAPASRWRYANRHAAQSLLEEAKKLDASGDPQCGVVLDWRARIPLD